MPDDHIVGKDDLVAGNTKLNDETTVSKNGQREKLKFNFNSSEKTGLLKSESVLICFLLCDH